jgi:hypothetical protein
MLGETKNQFSLTRAALSKGRRLEGNFLSVLPVYCLQPTVHGNQWLHIRADSIGTCTRFLAFVILARHH